MEIIRHHLSILLCWPFKEPVFIMVVRIDSPSSNQMVSYTVYL